MVGKGPRNHLRATGKAWREQKTEVKAPARKSIELEFLPAYLEVIERPPSRVGRLMSVAVMVLCAAALLWSIYGKLDVISSAPGRIVVGQYSKSIQAAEAGVVTRIAAWNGQAVREGDVLIELNPTSAKADMRRLRWQADVAALSVARYEALLSTDPLAQFSAPMGISSELEEQALGYLKGEWAVQEASRETFRSQLLRNGAQETASKRMLVETRLLLETVEERHSAIKRLAEKGNYPRLELLRLWQEVIEQRRTVAEQDAELGVLRAQAETLTTDMLRQEAEWRQDILKRLEESRARLVDLRQELIKAEETTRMQTIVAPVKGVVQQLSVHTIGGVVSPGQALMTIVPETEDLEAEVNILNRDVGFIRAGQEVEVKVESFPYTKYGTIKGELLHVSRDSISDEELGFVYPARVRLDALEVRTKDEVVQLSAGMLLTAEIRTGERRLIDYLLSPLQEYQSEALRER